MSMPRKIPCRVETVDHHGEGVYTVVLEPEARVPSFQPGQFLHLTVDDYDPAGHWPESRVFSIASSPSRRERLTILYSVKGRYTRKMADTLAPGRRVWVKLPYGEFVIDRTRPAVLVAGGTGISAFTAFIESLSREVTSSTRLLYGVRTPELLLFRGLILRSLSMADAFDMTVYLERSSEDGSSRALDHERCAVLIGRIDFQAVWEELGSLNAIFYLSGPPIMLRDLSQDLLVRGVSSDQIRMDAWE